MRLWHFLECFKIEPLLISFAQRERPCVVRGNAITKKKEREYDIQDEQRDEGVVFKIC